MKRQRSKGDAVSVLERQRAGKIQRREGGRQIPFRGVHVERGTFRAQRIHRAHMIEVGVGQKNRLRRNRGTGEEAVQIRAFIAWVNDNARIVVPEQAAVGLIIPEGTEGKIHSISSESRIRVTGPSLIEDTCISAPNSPC